MASLKDIRNRILSVRSTRKITSAMKVVSAAKFHKAQDAQAKYARYHQAYTYSLALAFQEAPPLSHELLSANPQADKRAYVVFSSNTALCGAYNINIVKQVQQLLADSPGADIYCVGRKVAEALERAGTKVAHLDTKLGDKPSMRALRDLYETLREDFVRGTYESVRIVYNHFVNAAVQQPREATLFPITLEFAREEGPHVEYIFEPTAESFFAHALPHYAKMNLYAALLSSYVGEHGARMTAMTQATDNANDLIDELTLEYNKVRQASITSEILEIVSGAEALQAV